ncbi:MAG: MurT ligase domain-containing protein [Candidatus Daviesbacteria bacterium]|nr:MurT ligase domain-containing protein [Candidatus Daviesbacteria bacterium]
MSIKLIAAILLGKIIFYITQILKIGGGSAAPGYYALKIYPNLVKDLASKIPQTIIITGTNGKTTTARMIAQVAIAHGLKIIRNSTGSNLERGIASTLIANCNLFPRTCNLDLAIWELDEAAFNNVALKLNPNMIVFLNAFRDQLDRYGEVDSVISKWCQTLTKIDHKTEILINGDDHNLLELKKCFKGKIRIFGVKDCKISGEKIIHQKENEKLNFEATNIQPRGLDKIEFKINSESFSLPVPGIYNVYNFLASYAVADYLQIPESTMKTALQNFSPAFGRVEKFEFGCIFLIKNPAGATQVLQTVAPEIKSQDRLLLALNDNFADGTDVSWIWDVNFEILHLKPPVIPHLMRDPEHNKLDSRFRGNDIIVSGTRAQDLALRLKYAGFDSNSIIVENILEKAFKEAQTGLKGSLFILPTYTALLELQSILTKQGLKNNYWEENK